MRRALFMRATAPIAAGLIYLSYAIWITWPMPASPKTRIWGPGGDVLGALSQWRELVEHAFPFAPGTVESFSAPEGLPVAYPLYVATWPSSLVMYLATWAFSAVEAMNLFVLASYVATGVAMVLLLRYLGIGTGVALLIGWAFAFRLDAIFNGTSAPDFAHAWVLPLLLWRLLVLKDSPTLANGVWAGLAGAVVVSWNAYYLLMGTVAFATLAVAVLLVSLRGPIRAVFKSLAASAAVLTGFAAIYVAVEATADPIGIRTPTREELYLYSARPLEYLVPPPHHPILGDLDLDLPSSLLREGNLYFYVGLVLFGLAVVGLFDATRGGAGRRVRENSVVVALLGVSALLWSGPPTASLGFMTLTLPSGLVSKLTLAWRIYGRFGILVSFTVCVLAAYGLATLVRRRRLPTRVAIVLLVGAAIVVDLRGLTFPTTVLSEPAIYEHLRRLPPGIVAEYPIGPAVFDTSDQLFRQEFHGMRILNGFAVGSAAEQRALALVRLDDPATARGLADLGVRYVVLDVKRDFGSALPPPGRPGPGFRLLAVDEPYELYELVAGG